MNAPEIARVCVGNKQRASDRHPLFWLRIKAGLTTTDLAKMAGMSHQSILLYERGRAVPGVDAAFRLAHALDVSVDRLFGIPYKKLARETSE